MANTQTHTPTHIHIHIHTQTHTHSGGGDWLHGVLGLQRRFLPYNGALGEKQVAWLKDTVSTAAAADEKVAVFCHQPVYAPCSNFNNLLWNYDEVQAVLDAHPATVVAWFAGHDHDGGYAKDQNGCHHIIPCSPLECAANQVSFGHVDVYSDRLVIDWTGKVPEHGESDTGLKEPWPRELQARGGSFMGAPVVGGAAS